MGKVRAKLQRISSSAFNHFLFENAVSTETITKSSPSVELTAELVGPLGQGIQLLSWPEKTSVQSSV